MNGCLAHLRALVRAREISAGAVQRYETSWVQITAALGWELDDEGKSKPIPLDTIVKASIADYVHARREEERSTSTILNDLTAWSHAMAYASNKGWVEDNPLRSIERRKLVGQRRTVISPPTDLEVAQLIEEVSEWSPDMGRLIRWLRRTGMRLGEALNLRRSDIHPCGTKATLRLGVKRNRGDDGGPMTRTIDLGRGADMATEMPDGG